MSAHLTDTDLSALFGLEMDASVVPVVAGEVASALCGKCKGRGNFIGYTGRIVGKCFACEGTGLSAAAAGKAPEGAEINVDGIVVAFASARESGIKSPKLRLDGFVFSRAPDHGVNAGSIYVKSTGGEYLGKVTTGRFLAVRACDDPTKARVINAAADPHKAAKAYGLKTGSCSCCGRELTNKESIDLGIGPICRDRFGW